MPNVKRQTGCGETMTKSNTYRLKVYEKSTNKLVYRVGINTCKRSYAFMCFREYIYSNEDGLDSEDIVEVVISHTCVMFLGKDYLYIIEEATR